MTRKPKAAATRERQSPTQRLPMVVAGVMGGTIAAIAVGTRVGIDIWKDQALAGKPATEAQLALFQRGLDPVFAISIVIAGLAIAAAEYYRIRFTLYYMAAGGLAVVAAAYAMGAAKAGITEPLVMWRVYATAGILGGTIYWLISGRNA